MVELSRAIQIAEQRLGRELTTVEMQLLAIVAAESSTTEAQLKTAPIDGSGTGSLYPNVSVSEAAYKQVQQIRGTAAVPGAPGGWVAPIGQQAPQPYDPFGIPSEVRSRGILLTKPTQKTIETEAFRFGGKPGPEVTSERVPGEERVVSSLYEYYGNPKNTNAVKDLQSKLVAAGYVEEGEFRAGIFDAQTQRAFGYAVQQYFSEDIYTNAKGTETRRGITFDESLSRAAKAFTPETKEEKKKKQLVEMLEDRQRELVIGKLTELWGVAPAASLVNSYVKSGMNVFEIDFNERQKPAFVKSPRAQAERIELESSLAQQLGSLGGSGFLNQGFRA